MKFFRNFSVRTKLTSIILFSCGFALLLSTGALVAYEAYTYRISHQEDLHTLAQLIARNCTAALASEDEAAAEKILLGLTASPQVLGAWVRDSEGNVFAEYRSVHKESSSVEGQELEALETPSTEEEETAEGEESE